VASYKKDDLCAKAAPPRHEPSPKGPVFVTVWWDEEIIQQRGEGASEIHSKQFLFRQSRYL
jgi:hypothetical protein